MIGWVEPTEETQQRLSVSSSHVWKLFVISHHCCRGVNSNTIPRSESLGVLKIWPAEDFFNVIFVTLDIHLFVDIFATNIADANFNTGPSFCCLFYVKRKQIINFCLALSKRALDQYFEMSVCLYVCLSVCVSVCLSPISRPLIGRANGFWQWFWHPTYPTRCSELGWAVPRSDFLAWLSSATLKISISGVSSRIWML